jgi:hypothetical protein
MFLVPKPGCNQWRLIIDLRELNRYCSTYNMTCETLKHLRHLSRLFKQETSNKKKQRRAGDHQTKREKREKPMLEGQEGMPQRQHYPPTKRRGDMNPRCHEEQRKDVA